LDATHVNQGPRCTRRRFGAKTFRQYGPLSFLPRRHRPLRAETRTHQLAVILR
jgi:hypothetical protein